MDTNIMNEILLEDLGKVESAWLGKMVEVCDVRTCPYDKSDVQDGDTGKVVEVGFDNEIGVYKLKVYLNSVGEWAGFEWWCTPLQVRVIEAKKEVPTNREAEIKTFITRYVSYLRGRTEEIEKRRSKEIANIQDLERRICTYNNSLRDLTRLKTSITNSISQIDTAKLKIAREELYALYNKVEFYGSPVVMFAITKPITMTFTDYDKSVRKIEMGVYEVRLDIMGDISFRVVKRVNPQHPDVSEMHPHINSGGSPCWGTFNNPIQERFKDSDYVGILKLVHQFLSECNKEGWYISGNAFGKDWAVRCDNCWEIRDNCVCDRCSRCEEMYDDCQCLKCPDSGDVIEEIGGDYCNGCNCVTENGGCAY